MKRIVCMLLALGMCMSLYNPVFATYDLSNSADMSLENEIAWLNQQQAQNKTIMDSSKDIYVPDGARILSVDCINNNLVVDYRLGDVRYIVTYLWNGTIEKTARKAGDDVIQQVSSSNGLIETVDLAEHSFADHAAEENNNDIAARSAKEVIPVMYTEFPDTAPYNAKIVATGTVSLPALRDLGYSPTQNYRIYETMDYFEKEDASGKTFNEGDAVSIVAAFWDVATAKAISWITLAGIGISALNKLEESCKAVMDCSYTFMGGKEAGIYDPTYHNTFVEVTEYWSQGLVAMTWDYNSSSGYHSPSWEHVGTCEALRINNSELKSEAQEIYNGNVQISGWWPHGAGRFGY